MFHVDEPKTPEAPSAAPPASPSTGRGAWVGIVVVAIVIVVLLAAVFGGLFGSPPVAEADHVQATADASASQPAGAAFNLTVRILDARGGTFTGYAGNVTFNSTDGNASLPARYGFTAGDAGVHAFSLVLKTAGDQRVDVNATNVTSPKASVTVHVVLNANASLWVIAIVAGEGQSGGNGTALSPFVSRVRDGFGNALPGVRVNYTLTEPGGFTGGGLSNNSTTTDAAGSAETTLTLGTGDGAGAYTVKAWLEAAPLVSVTFHATKSA